MTFIPAEQTHSISLATAATKVAGSMGFGSLRVLVVDNKADVRELITVVLESDGM